MELLPSLNNLDSMLLLHQHGEFSGHLKYVLTLQDDVPLWRRGSGFRMSGLMWRLCSAQPREASYWGWTDPQRPEAVVTFCCLSSGET